METPNKYIVHDKEYEVIRTLGKGKSGYAYLVSYKGALFSLKKIHHEPCDYYQFGDKLMAEINAYSILKDAGIRVPELFDFDKEQEIIIKEYIDGETADYYIKKSSLPTFYLEDLKKMAERVKEKGYNLDYYPTNFVPREEGLYYVDFELNPYEEKWNLENWGLKYWSLTEEFKKAFNIE